MAWSALSLRPKASSGCSRSGAAGWTPCCSSPSLMRRSSPGWTSAALWSNGPTTIRRQWPPGWQRTGSRPRRCCNGMSRGNSCGEFPLSAAWRRLPNVFARSLAESMITLKSPREIDIMSRAGRIVAATLARMREILRPGLSTEDLDAEAERFIRSHEGAIPSFKGLYGFPKTLCTSIDEEIVHGIPSPRRVLSEGSIVSVDVGVQLEGLHADSATTLPVGRVDSDAERLLRVTQESLTAGIAQARVGNHVGDIGHAVQRVAEGAGYGVVRELVGHGIGTRFHEEPQVPNYGAPKRGPRLLEGMTLAIEPMITVGSPVTKTLSDKWTVVTADGSLSAHFEHTVVITANGPRILTTT